MPTASSGAGSVTPPFPRSRGQITGARLVRTLGFFGLRQRQPAPPHNCSESWPWRGLIPTRTWHPPPAARSTPASRPRRASSRSSTPSTPSARPARPISVSQKHEGWARSPTLYDDGGFSGGNMERPALKRLLADIAAGKIDVVVVYKVDRLTRSLADFAKIVEVFDAHRRLVRLGHPGVQHHDQHGPADAQRAAVLRPVRARGHRRAHPRQDRRLEDEGHVDGRPAAARLRRQGPQARRQRGRGRDRPADLPALSRTRLGSLLKAALDARGVVSKRREGSRRERATAARRSRAARSTRCCRTGSIAARSSTRAQPIPASTRRSSIGSFGNTFSTLAAKRHERLLAAGAGERQADGGPDRRRRWRSHDADRAAKSLQAIPLLCLRRRSWPAIGRRSTAEAYGFQRAISRGWRWIGLRLFFASDD